MASYGDSDRTSANVVDKRTNVPGQGLWQPDIPKVKRNIKKMLDQGAPEEDIDAYLAGENVTTEMLGGKQTAPQADPNDPETANPERSDWTPEMRQAYGERRGEIDKTPEMARPGYARRAQHSVALGGSDELWAGAATAIETPFAILRGDKEGIRDRFNRHWAGQQADLDYMRQNTDGALGTAADVAGGFAMGAPKAVGNAMLAAAPKAFDLSKSLVKYGAAFGGGHAFLENEGGVMDRAASVPEGATTGALGSLVFGHAMNKGFNAMAKYRAGKAARAQQNSARLDEMQEAGVENPLPAAVSGGPIAETATRGIGGTFVGGPIRQQAAENVSQLQGRFNSMLDAKTGGRSSDELGGEAQDLLKHQLTGRSIPSEEVQSLPAEKLQDITNLPLPENYQPKPVKVAPTQPREVDPITPGQYLDEVARNVPEAPPVPPREVKRENFKPQAQTVTESDVDLPARLIEPYNSSLAEIRAAEDSFKTVDQILKSKWDRLVADAEAVGIGIKGDQLDLPRHMNPEQKRFVKTRMQAFVAEQKIANSQMDAAEARYLDAETRHRAARDEVDRFKAKSLTRKQRRAELNAEDEAGSRYNSEVEAARREADAARTLATQKARNEAMEREAPAAIQSAARRTEEMRAQAAKEAKTETAKRQREAEEAQQQDIEERRARFGQEQQKRTFPEATAKNYVELKAKRDQAARDYSAATKEVNADPRGGISGSLKRQTDAFNAHMKAENDIAALLKPLEAQLKNRGANDNSASSATGKIIDRAGLQTELDRILTQEAALPPLGKAPPRNPLGATREHTYVTEADAGYEMGRRHTPNIQRNPVGAPGRPTETSKLITSFATEARGAGRLPGFKGNVFDDAGKLRPDVRKMLSDDLGETVAERLAYLVERRAGGQFSPGIKGLHDIRTLIGREMADAGKYREPGMSRGPSEAALARLYKAFAKDIDTIRNVAPGGAAATKMRHEQDEDYSKLIEDLKRPLGQLFKDGVSPVQALDKLVAGAKKGDLDMLRPYMRVMREKGDPIKAAATIVQHTIRGAKDLSGVVKGLGDIRPETRDLLFAGKEGQAYRAALEKLEKVAKMLEPYSGLAKPSASSVTRQTLRPSTLITAAALYHQFWPALIATGGMAGAAKFLSSPRYVRWLTKIPDVTRQGIAGKDALRHLARLTGITATDTQMGGPILDAAISAFSSTAHAGETDEQDMIEGKLPDTEIEDQGPDDEPNEQDAEQPEHHSHSQPRDSETGQFMEYRSNDRMSMNVVDQRAPPGEKSFRGALYGYEWLATPRVIERADSGDIEGALWEMTRGEEGFTDGGAEAIEEIAKRLGVPAPWEHEGFDWDGGNSPSQGNAMRAGSGMPPGMPPGMSRGGPIRSNNAMRAFGGR